MAYCILREFNPTPEWSWGGSVAYLRIFASEGFFEQSTGEYVAQGRTGDINSFCQTITCPVTDEQVSIPEVTLASTSDSSNPSARFTAILYDSKNVPRYTLLSQGVVDLDFFQTPAESSILVTDAGTAAANQYYVFSGTSAGFNYYNVRDEAASVTLSAIVNTGSEWRLYNAAGTNLYHSSNNPDLPFDATWVTGGSSSGSLPVPTVAENPELVTATWEQLIVSNQGIAQNFFNETWTIPQIKQYVNSIVGDGTTPFGARLVVGKLALTRDPVSPTNPIAVASNDYVWEGINETVYLSSYGTTMADYDAAITAIGATQTELKITSQVAITANRTTPTNVVVTTEGDGSFTVSGGATLTVSSMTPAAPKQIFFGAGSAVFAKNAVPYMDLSWWAGRSNAGDVTTSFTQATTSLTNNSGGALHIPPGVWKTTVFTPPSGSVIQGAGTGVNATNATVITLADLVSATCVMKVSEAFRDITIRDLTLSTSTSTASNCLLIQGTAPNSASGLLCENVTFHGTGTASPAQCYVKDLGGSWEVINAKFSHCMWITPTNGKGFRCDTSNTSIHLDQPFFFFGVGATASYLDHFGSLAITNPTFNGLSSIAATSTLDRTVAGSITIGTKNLVFTAGAVGLNDIGQRVVIAGKLDSNITGITSATTCTVEDNASATATAESLGVYRYTPSTGMAKAAIWMTGGHGNLVVEGSQDEGLQYFLINDASQEQYPLVLSGCNIQAKILLNQSITIQSSGNSYFSQTFEDGAASSAKIISVGDYVDKTSMNILASGVGVELLVPRIWGPKAGGSIFLTQLNNNQSQLLQEIGMPITVKHGEVYAGDPQRTLPVFSVGSSSTSSGGVTKPQIRFGRLNSVTEEFDYYYDIFRDYDTGFCYFVGNQTGFRAYVFDDDLSAAGTITSTDATTPILATATGKTNTGYLSLPGKTSGSFKILPADAMGQIMTVAPVAQTVGAVVLTIPNFANVNDTFVFLTLAQTLSNKTFVAPALGTPASGVATNLTGTAAGLTAGALSGLNATATELNQLNDVSAYQESITSAGALSVTKVYSGLAIAGAGAVTLAVPSATMLGQQKLIEMVSDGGDLTLSLANCVGGSAATTCTFNDVGDQLVLIAGSLKWIIIKEQGVVLT